MAAITWSLSANGAGASTVLTAAASTVLVSGDLAGGSVSLEVSHNNTNFASPVSSTDAASVFGRTAGVYSLAIPAGWYVRPSLRGATGTPSVVIAVE